MASKCYYSSGALGPRFLHSMRRGLSHVGVLTMCDGGGYYLSRGISDRGSLSCYTFILFSGRDDREYRDYFVVVGNTFCGGRMVLRYHFLSSLELVGC